MTPSEARAVLADAIHDDACECGDRADHEKDTGVSFMPQVDWAVANFETVAVAAGGTVRTQPGVRPRGDKGCEIPDDTDVRAHKGDVAVVRTAVEMPWREADPTPPTWHCPRCGSDRWVQISLTQGWTFSAQCVPCGKITPLPKEGTTA